MWLKKCMKNDIAINVCMVDMKVFRRNVNPIITMTWIAPTIDSNKRSNSQWWIWENTTGKGSMIFDRVDHSVSRHTAAHTRRHCGICKRNNWCLCKTTHSQLHFVFSVYFTRLANDGFGVGMLFASLISASSRCFASDVNVVRFSGVTLLRFENALAACSKPLRRWPDDVDTCERSQKNSWGKKMGCECSRTAYIYILCLNDEAGRCHWHWRCDWRWCGSGWRGLCGRWWRRRFRFGRPPMLIISYSKQNNKIFH